MADKIEASQVALLFQLMPSIVPIGWEPVLVPAGNYFKARWQGWAQEEREGIPRAG